MDWFIKAREIVYGPYSIERMTQFANEGRLGLKTLVANHREQEFEPAEQDQTLLKILSPDHHSPSRSQSVSDNTALTEQRKYVLHTRLSEDVQAEFISNLQSFGQAFEPMPGLWVLSTQVSCDRLRNALSKVLTAHDHLLIFEIKNNQAAWFNIGEDEDRRFRQFLS